jgi:hypothetical protein
MVVEVVVEVVVVVVVVVVFEMALALMTMMLIHNHDPFLIRVLANIVRVTNFFERLDEDRDARWS